MNPKSEIDEFELQRRRRETANEIVINAALAGLLIVMLAIQFLSLANPDPTAFRPPLQLLFVQASGLLSGASIIVYLRRNPPYHTWRKYVTTLLAVLFNFVSNIFLVRLVPSFSLIYISLAFHILAVILSGLRFDTRLVIVTGSVALAAQLLFFLCFIPDYSHVLVTGILTVVILGVATTCVTYIVSDMLQLHRESVRKEMLGRFLAPEVVAEICAKPSLLKMTTETRTATILFADIRGFTTFSESHPAAEVGQILNSVLEEMTASIMDNQGMVDKYIGDAIMGVFGAPVATGDHALHATMAALEMQRRIGQLNLALAESKSPPVSIGVGIHSGEVIAGAFGSQRRLEYTVIGDTVNVASRIESLNKQYQTGILLSGQTRDLLKGAVLLKEVATTKVKGREQPLTLFSPVV